MALNIDTVRSPDANKTYHLANSIGQAKASGETFADHFVSVQPYRGE